MSSWIVTWLWIGMTIQNHNYSQLCDMTLHNHVTIHELMTRGAHRDVTSHVHDIMTSTSCPWLFTISRPWGSMSYPCPCHMTIHVTWPFTITSRAHHVHDYGWWVLQKIERRGEKEGRNPPRSGCGGTTRARGGKKRDRKIYPHGHHVMEVMSMRVEKGIEKCTLMDIIFFGCVAWRIGAGRFFDAFF